MLFIGISRITSGKNKFCCNYFKVRSFFLVEWLDYNALCLPPRILHNHSFPIFPGNYSHPKINQRQWLCKVLAFEQVHYGICKKRWIGHLHYDVFLLLRPEFILFFLSDLNLVIPVRPLDNKSPNLHKKEKSWRILVVLVKDAIV